MRCDSVSFGYFVHTVSDTLFKYSIQLEKKNYTIQLQTRFDNMDNNFVRAHDGRCVKELVVVFLPSSRSSHDDDDGDEAECDSPILGQRCRRRALVLVTRMGLVSIPNTNRQTDRASERASEPLSEADAYSTKQQRRWTQQRSTNKQTKQTTVDVETVQIAR